MEFITYNEGDRYIHEKKQLVNISKFDQKSSITFFMLVSLCYYVLASWFHLENDIT